MKKFLAGLLTGLILATATISFAADPIKLKVNGKHIDFPEAPPTIINGRTMVPARPLAEALGAKVEWDAANRTVVVTGGVDVNNIPTDLPPVNGLVDEPSSPVIPPKTTPDNLISLKELHDKYGAEVTIGGSSDEMVIKLKDLKAIATKNQLFELRDKGKILIDVLIDNIVVGQITIEEIDNRLYVDKSILDFVN